MRYVTTNGESFHLAYNTPDEWADAVTAAFRKLGCSDEYAKRAGDKYRNIVR